MARIAPTQQTRGHVLVVADWRAAPDGVIAACRRRASHEHLRFAFIVPAWLHGLDWAGDPNASRPCAARQLETLVHLAEGAGLDVRLAEVGDPDPTSAVDDALAAVSATAILLFRDRPRRRHLLDLPHRLHRLTGLAVETPPIPTPAPVREPRRRRAFLGGGHCVTNASGAL